MPRTPRNPKSRETLIEKGLELALRRGYHGTGINDVVAAADVPKGSFYNHFDSKEAFMAELIRRYGSRLREVLSALFDDATSDDPLAKLGHAYRIIAQLQETNELQGCLIGNLTAELGPGDTACQEAARAEVAAWSEQVTQLLARGQAAGTVRTDYSAADLAQFFWDSWEGALLRAKADGTKAALDRAILMLDSFFRTPSPTH